MSFRIALPAICFLLAVVCRAADPPPNFVIVYCDDMGYGDVGCFGCRDYKTPHIDQLAREGMRLTDFHTAAAVCSASRVALLTGCYPQRVGILGALGPKAKIGIHDDEVLLPEILKERGYATAIFGKWHLGDDPKFLPTRHGFDRYFGLPYSNDMWPNHPTNKTFPPLPLIEGEKVVELMPDQSQLTTWYTERAVKFIEDSKNKPFILYVPHSMPHVPLFVSSKFKDKSGAGLYGDVIQEIDWSVGQILAALKEHGLDERTLVIFSSDNGPWLSYGNHAGSAGPLREGKGTTWEGGQRVPCIARWPGRIEAGSECRELSTTMDILPTLAKLAGGKAPEDRKIDGRDIWMLLSGQMVRASPEPSLYYYWDHGLDAVRMGPWKLVFPHKFRSLTGPAGRDGQPGGYTEATTELALFNLDADMAEKKNVAAEHPQIVADLERLAEQARDDLGDSHQNRLGKNRRQPGRLAP
jgi:arylsulfatase A